MGTAGWGCAASRLMVVSSVSSNCLEVLGTSVLKKRYMEITTIKILAANARGLKKIILLLSFGACLGAIASLRNSAARIKVSQQASQEEMCFMISSLFWPVILPSTSAAISSGEGHWSVLSSTSRRLADRTSPKRSSTASSTDNLFLSLSIFFTAYHHSSFFMTLSFSRPIFNFFTTGDP